MALVDFSSAVIEPINSYLFTSYTNNQNCPPLALGSGNWMVDDTGTSITSSLNHIQLLSSATHLEHVMTGIFSASGTEFYLRHSGGNMWKISNISFSSGDTFSYKITVVIS